MWTNSDKECIECGYPVDNARSMYCEQCEAELNELESAELLSIMMETVD